MHTPGRRGCGSPADVSSRRRVAPGGRFRVEAWLFSGGSEAQALRQGDGQLGLGSQDRHPTQVVIVGEELNNYISDKNSLPFFTQNIHCKIRIVLVNHYSFLKYLGTKVFKL